MYALQTSCSDSIYLVRGPPLKWKDIPYTAPTYIIEILDEARRCGLVAYDFFDLGPLVPIYFTRDRIKEAKRIAEKGAYEPSEDLLKHDDMRGRAITTRLYSWLILVAEKCGFRELGYAFHRHKIGERLEDFAVLIIDGKVYTYGSRPRSMEEYISTSAVSDYASIQFIEAFNWLKKILGDKCPNLPEPPTKLLEYINMAKRYSK